MHQDFSELEDSLNARHSWSPSKSEQAPMKMQGASSPFVPTINAITSSQELQWMVQPAVIASMPGSGLCPYSYNSLDRSSAGPIRHTRQGVIHTVSSTHRRSRHRHIQLDQNEEEKRRLRRERNKMAAAKCRNRRRELTDQLQEETEDLEREQAGLQNQVEELQKERQRLENILLSHASICRFSCDNVVQPATSHPHSPLRVKQEPVEESHAFFQHHQHSTNEAPYHHHLQDSGEYCRNPDCFSTSPMDECSPGQAMDLSSPMLPNPSHGGEERDRTSPKEETLSKDTVPKLNAASSTMSLEDGALGLLSSPTLLTL